jgi:hypothetical protein
VISVRDYAPGAYPDNYAGIASGTPESADRLVVFLVDPTPAIEADLRAQSGILDPTKVVFERGWLSTAESAALDAGVASAAPELMADGMQIQSYGVGVDGVEEIGVHELTEEQDARLFELFGPYLRVSEVAENSFGEYSTPDPH